jgi:hypothetical protein
MRESCTYGSVRGARGNSRPLPRLPRREFITLLGGGAAAWPLAARAQQGDRVRRIGVLLSYAGGDPEAFASVGAFLQGLQQLGWTDGRNMRVDYRATGGDATGTNELPTRGLGVRWRHGSP